MHYGQAHQTFLEATRDFDPHLLQDSIGPDLRWGLGSTFVSCFRYTRILDT